ncbi:hypothetical protein ABK040_014587 [Willaertia magna]
MEDFNEYNGSAIDEGSVVSSNASQNKIWKEEEIFTFISTLRVNKKFHNFIYWIVHLVLLLQTITIIITDDYKWGETLQIVIDYFMIFRTVGLQFIASYDVSIGILIAFMVLQIVALIFLLLSFQGMNSGSKYWKYFKLITRGTCIIMALFGPIFTSKILTMWHCSYETGTLHHFPSVACWGIPNAPWAVVGLVFVITQTIFTCFAVLIFFNLSPLTHFATIDPYFSMYYVAGNQVCIFIGEIFPDMIEYMRPVTFILISIGFVVVIVERCPFYSRRTNSIYSGIGGMRVGLGIGSLLSLYINPDNNWELGLVAFFVTLVLGVLFFITGLILMYIYLMYIEKTTLKNCEQYMNKKIETEIGEVENIPINFRHLEIATRFKILTYKEPSKDLIYYKLIERLILKRVLLTTRLYLTSSLLSEEENKSQSLRILQKTYKISPNILNRLSIDLVRKYVEENTPDGQADIIRRVLNKVKRKQIHIVNLSKSFWKIFADINGSGGDSKEDKIKNLRNYKKFHEGIEICQKIRTISEEITRIYNSLMVNYPKSHLIVRSYAEYLDKYLLKTVSAEQYYALAEEIEEDESKRKRITVYKSPTAKKGENKVFPVVDDKMLNDEAFFDEEEKSRGECDDKSNTSFSNDQKATNTAFYKEQISKKENREILKYAIPFIGIIVVVALLSLSIVTDRFMRSQNPSTISKACKFSTIPYFTLSSFRQYQLLNLPAPILNQKIELLTASLNLVVSHYAIVVGDTNGNEDIVARYWKNFNYTVRIPIPFENETLSIGKQVPYNVKTYSLIDLTEQYINSLRKVIYSFRYNFNEVSTSIKLKTNYYFLYQWYNDNQLADYYETYCTKYYEKYTSDSNNYVNIIIIIGSAFGGIILFIALCFIPLIVYLFRLKGKVLQLFLQIPREDVGRVYRSTKNFASKISTKNVPSNRESVFQISTNLVIVFAFLVIILCLILGTALICYESISIEQTSNRSFQLLEIASAVSKNINKLVFLVLEYSIRDPELPIVEKDLLTTSGSQNFTKLSEIIFQTISSIEYEWNILKFGNSNFKGLQGRSRELDALILFGDCVGLNSTEALNRTHCNSLNEILNEVTTNGELLGRENELYTMSQKELFSKLFEILKFSERLLTSFSTLVEIFTNVVEKEKRIEIIWAISIPFTVVTLICTLIIFLFTSRYISEIHQIREMFNYVPVDTIENTPVLRDYILLYDMNIDKDETEEDSYDTSKAIMNIASEAILITNENGVIVENNATALKIFNKELSDIIGLSISLLYDSQENIPQIIKELVIEHKKSSSSTSRSFECNCKRKTELFPSLSSVHTIQGKGGKVLCSFFIKDITYEKKNIDLLEKEKKNSENLMNNILPKRVANRLMSGEQCIAEQFDSVTALFSDVVGFTEAASKMSAYDLVMMLNQIVGAFDNITEKYGVHKIKTIGDAYFGVTGLNMEPNHVEQMVRFAIEMINALAEYNISKRKQLENEGIKEYKELKIRIGINTGRAVAGVIGTKKFAYDLWGDTINVASRMESNSLPGRIQLSRVSYERVHDMWKFEEREIEVKGKGNMKTYLLIHDEPLITK